MTKFTRWLFVAVVVLGWSHVAAMQTAFPSPFLIASASAAQSFTINVTKVARNATVDEKWFVKPSAQ